MNGQSDIAIARSARELLRRYPDGMTPRQLVRNLLRSKVSSSPLARGIVAELLSGRPEFEELDGRWFLADSESPVVDDARFVVVDVETTGCLAAGNRIIEIAAFVVVGGRIAEGISTLINPGHPIPPEITHLTGITDAHVEDAPLAAEVMPELLDFISDAVFTAHSAGFDLGFINGELALCGLPPIKNEILCTVKLARRAFPGFNSYGLDSLVAGLGLHLDTAERHRARGDAAITAELLLLCIDRLKQSGVGTLEQALRFTAMPVKSARGIIEKSLQSHLE
jgi:DNA polymerase III subunit epsilon